MLKILLNFILTFGISMFSFAQNGNILKIIYQKPYSLNNESEVLLANKKEAKSQIVPKNVKEGKFGSIDKNIDNQINVVIANDVMPVTYFKSTGSSLLKMIDFVGKERYDIVDSLPRMEWRLVPGETKKIGSYSCNKATLEFRGTSWVAWYTPDIPIPYGPWKFMGLPGVILEIGDAYVRQNSWVVSEIIYPYSNTNEVLSYTAAHTLMPLRKFVKKQEDTSRKMAEMIKAKAPKDATQTEIFQTRIGAEKKYEWE